MIFNVYRFPYARDVGDSSDLSVGGGVGADGPYSVHDQVSAGSIFLVVVASSEVACWRGRFIH